jgi:hypothetical protein
VGMGLAVAVLGGAVVTAFYLYPGPTEVEGTPHPFTLAAVTDFSIAGLPGGSPKFNLHWTATGLADVGLYPEADCTGTTSCPSSSALANWTGRTNASWSHQGPLPFPLTLLAGPEGNLSITFSFVATTSVASAPAAGSLVSILVDLSSGALLVVGGLGIFLGLFLRSNPYGPPRPLVSHHPDDSQRIADMMDEGGPGRPFP